MPWGAVAGAVVSAGIGAATKGGQSEAISQGQQQSNAISQAAIDESKKIYQPFMDTGQHALTGLADFSGLNGADAAGTAMKMFTASPGYGYQVEQGLRAVDAGAASRGMLRSGATLKAEQTLGANLANQDFGAYMGRLGSLADIGLRGTNAYTGLLGEQSKSMADTNAKAGGAQAGIVDQFGNKVANAANTGVNSLYQLASDKGWFGGGAASDPFAGAGGGSF